MFMLSLREGPLEGRKTNKRINIDGIHVPLMYIFST